MRVEGTECHWKSTGCECAVKWGYVGQQSWSQVGCLPREWGFPDVHGLWTCGEEGYLGLGVLGTSGCARWSWLQVRVTRGLCARRCPAVLEARGLRARWVWGPGSGSGWEPRVGCVAERAGGEAHGGAEHGGCSPHRDGAWVGAERSCPRQRPAPPRSG